MKILTLVGALALLLAAGARAQIETTIEPANALLNDAALDWLDLIGRVKPGADKKAMEAQMQVELRQFLLSPESKVEDRSKPLIAKQTLHFSPGGGGVQQQTTGHGQGGRAQQTCQRS